MESRFSCALISLLRSYQFTNCFDDKLIGYCNLRGFSYDSNSVSIKINSYRKNECFQSNFMFDLLTFLGCSEGTTF